MSATTATPVRSFGSKAATAFGFECGLFFCRQPMEVAGKTREVVAVWKANDTNDAPVYAMVIDKYR